MSEEVMLNFISADQAWERFDRATQDLLNLSGEEFARRLDAGDLAGLPQSPAMRVAMMRREQAA